jgi:hypothetical protein
MCTRTNAVLGFRNATRRLPVNIEKIKQNFLVTGNFSSAKRLRFSRASDGAGGYFIRPVRSAVIKAA